MRIPNIASSLMLCSVLLLDLHWRKRAANAFSITALPIRRSNKACSNSRPESSMHAFDPLDVVDAATAAIASLGPEFETVKDTVLSSTIPISFDSAVVGAVSLPIGWTLGVLSQQGGNKKIAGEEAKRFEKILKEKANEIEGLNVKLVEAEVKQIETKESIEESTETLRNDFERKFPGLLQIVRYDVDKVLEKELVKNDTVHY